MFKSGIVTCDDCAKVLIIKQQGKQWQSWWRSEKDVPDGEEVVMHRCKKCDMSHPKDERIMDMFDSRVKKIMAEAMTAGGQ